MAVSNKARPIALVAGVLLLGWAIWSLATREPGRIEEAEPPVRPVKSQVLERPAPFESRFFPGRVRAQDRVELSFRVGGPLEELPVKAGAEVEAGQVLARIDPRDFEVALERVRGRLEEERSRLQAMKAGERAEVVRMLEQAVAAAQAEFDEAEAEFARVRQLLESGAATASEFDAAERRLEVSRAKLESSQEDLKRGRAGARAEDIAAQQARIDSLVAEEREAANALEDTTLRAPFAGRIARLEVDNFQEVRPKMPVLSLQDVSTVEITVDVPEAIIARIQKEEVDAYVARFDFLPDREYEVELEEAEVEADRRTQTYAVTFVMPAPEDVRILPGMTATVELRRRRPEVTDGGAWQVDVDAVFADDRGRSWVWRVDPQTSRVERVAVQAGEVTGEQLVVRGDLSAGDRVVIAGVNFLVDGQSVRPLEETQEQGE